MSKHPSHFLKTCFIAFTLICTPFSAHALSIEEAYKAIPHSRTVFLAQHSKIPPSEAFYINQLLNLAERAMVLRVTAMKQGAVQSHYHQHIREVLDKINALTPPDHVKPAQSYILAAIDHHREYFLLSQSSRNKAQQNQLIQKSGIVANNYFVRIYPESRNSPYRYAA